METRLNKYLSEIGFCSRREADRLIEQRKVLIDNKIAVVGMKVKQGQQVVVNGIEVEKQDKFILIAYNKPKGVICTSAKEDPNNIIDAIHYPKRIYPIGRLDKESEGLILLTNNGELVNKISRGSNQHEKEYLVKVNKKITTTFLKGMERGVPILDTITKPCIIKAEGKDLFRIIITQGLNRQIRRMCEYFEYHVLELKRVRIMNIQLGRLKTGTYRNITEQEFNALNKLLVHSKQ